MPWWAGGAWPTSREEVKEVDLADPGRGGGGWGWGGKSEISDRWFSATSAPFSMILDVSGRSARVLFVSDVIFYVL